VVVGKKWGNSIYNTLKRAQGESWRMEKTRGQKNAKVRDWESLVERLQKRRCRPAMGDGREGVFPKKDDHPATKDRTANNYQTEQSITRGSLTRGYYLEEQSKTQCGWGQTA